MQLLLILLDVLLPVLELLGLGPHHKQPGLDLVGGVVEIAQVFAAVVVQVHLHVAHPVRLLQLAVGQRFDFAVRLCQQELELVHGLNGLFELAPGLVLEDQHAIVEFLRLWGRQLHPTDSPEQRALRGVPV
ncbi:MAG TPA: hypothetical protein VKB09_01675 [Thermomicrobiales bacterium]|nr:hypothetical protein [Thermomicrobiales bacterium]